MSLATLDRVLAVLVLALAGSGMQSLKAGSTGSAWVFTLHGLLGGALLAATVLKLWHSAPRAIARGRWRHLALALAVALLAIGALTGGFLWVAGGELLKVGSWTVMTLHAWLGLLLLPLIAAHLLPHRWRVVSTMPQTGVSRRSLLITGGLALAGVAAFGASAVLEHVRGGTRRFTGSRWLPAGGIPPSTTFYGEGPPPLDVDAWRLAVGDRSLSLSDLRALGEIDRSAILDCTSGWALETVWRGVPLPTVLSIPDRGSVRVSSVTGWSTILTADEARTALLATGVAGAPLLAANGAPCRLVVPGRRGLDWVKWVSEVTIA